MKSSHKIVIFACLALILVIAVFSWAIFRGDRLSESAQEIALQIVQDTFSADYPTLLIDNSHPDLQEASPEGLLVRYVNGVVRQTGPLESIESIRGSAEVPLISFAQSGYLAAYQLKLNFRNTPADVEIDLQYLDNRWLVTRLTAIADILRN